MKYFIFLVMMLMLISCKDETSVNQSQSQLITPDISILVNPKTAHKGDTVVVSWSVQNAIRWYCNFASDVLPSGRLIFFPQTNTVYTITAVSKDGVNTSVSDSVKLEPWRYKISTTVVGSGAILKSPDSLDYVENSSIKLTAIPDSGWIFTGWTGDITTTTNSITLSMNSNKKLTATFRQIQYFTLSINILGNGRVVKSPEQITYREGTNVNVSAVPDSGGNYFVNWSGDVNSTAPNIIITLNSNKTINATFKQIQYYTLSINILGNGKVTKSPEQSTYREGTLVNLYAVPDTGNKFINWSGNANSSASNIIVTMDNNKTINATFGITTPDTVQIPSLIAYYPFNGNANDMSGNNHGILHGVTPTTDRFGLANKAYKFNGINNYIEIPTSIMSQTLTISAWVRLDPNISGMSNCFIAKNPTGKATEFALSMSHDATPRHFRPHLMLSNWTYFDGNKNIQTGIWYYATMTYDGTTIKSYINSEIDGSYNASGTVKNGPGTLLIGAYYLPNYPYWFNGDVDDIRIYNRALTILEIQQLYHENGY